MTNIPDRPFDKIATDPVSDPNGFTSGNQHIPATVDHLMGWPVAFPIPDKEEDTIIYVFINNYLPIHTCPCFILSDNGTNLKNQLMDNVLKHLALTASFPPNITHKVMEN